MRHQQPINTREACILAVEALDNIVIDLLQSSPLETSPDFLDWVADEATPLVQLSVINALRVPRFVDSLRLGPPKIGMTHWVRHWLGPLIALKFVGMAIQPGPASAHPRVHLLPVSANTRR